MKTVIYWFMSICILHGTSNLFAQKGTVSAGGDASGSGGSVSFSIGQVDYLATESAGGKINQGLQVPYEIFVETGLEVQGISIEAEVFPNPTSQDIFLQIEDWQGGELTYELFELQGKLLISKLINEKKTRIPLENYSASAYLLLVRQDLNSIKTFRIIKK